MSVSSDSGPPPSFPFGKRVTRSLGISLFMVQSFKLRSFFDYSKSFFFFFFFRTTDEVPTSHLRR